MDHAGIVYLYFKETVKLANAPDTATTVNVGKYE